MELKKIILLIIKTTILISLLVSFLRAIQRVYILLFELFWPRYGGKGMNILGIIVMVPLLGLAMILSWAPLFLFWPKTKDNWIFTIKSSKEHERKLPLMNSLIKINKYIVFGILGLIGLIWVLITTYFIYIAYSSLLGIFLILNSILWDSVIDYSKLFLILWKTLWSGCIGIWLLYMTMIYYYNYRKFKS